MPSDGWGLSTIFDELLTREPDRIPVTDIQSLQSNLITQGYVDSDTPIDGNWGPTWSSAFRRADRDSYEQVRAGKHWLSAPVTSGVTFISQVIPSNVMKNVIGAAKGWAEQTPETVTRVGALGGAAAGAAIGTAIAPGVGTLVGAVGGAVTGFVADLFAGDENDEGEEGGEGISGADILDALTPFEEYTGKEGVRSFFEDLGWVATAAGSIAAIRLGAAGVAGARGAAAAQGSWTTKTVAETPGIINRAVSSILGKASPAAGQAAGNWMRMNGLMAQSTRPWIQATNGVFTGLSTAGMTGRYAGGFGSGEDTTKIEKGIEQANEFVEDHRAISFGLHAIDNTLGWIINPTAFTPVKGLTQATVKAGSLQGIKPYEGIELANILRTRFQTDHMQPYILAAQRKGLSYRDAVAEARRALGDDLSDVAGRDFYARLSFGVEKRIAEDLHMEEMTRKGPLSTKERGQLHMAAKVTLHRRINQALTDDHTTPLDDIKLLDELLSYSQGDNIYDYAAWVERLGGGGSGLDRFPNFARATEEVQRLQARLEDADDPFTVATDAEKITLQNFERTKINAQIRTIKKDIDRLEERFAKTGDVSLQDAITQGKEEIKELTRARNKIEKLEVEPKVFLSLGNKRDDARNLPGYQTKEEIDELRTNYEVLVDRKKIALKTLKTDRTEQAQQAATVASRELHEFVDDLVFRGLLSDEWRGRGATMSDLNKQVVKALDDHAQFAGRRVNLPDDVRQTFDELGYQVIAVREDPLRLGNFVDRIKPFDDFSRRRNFWDTIGFSAHKISDKSLFHLRESHMANSLNAVLAQYGIKMTGDEALRRIHKHLEVLNKGGADGDSRVHIFSLIAREGNEAWWKRLHFYKVDPRELKPEDLVDALGLSKLDADDGLITALKNELTALPAGETVRAQELNDQITRLEALDHHEVSQKLHHAVKTGSALGGEAEFLHPVDSMRMLAKNLRVSGLPGASDFMRTWHIKNPARAGTVTGAATGAAMGYEEEGSLQDAAVGAFVGAGFGLSGGSLFTKTKAFQRGTYGYLPDKLHRANMALRYSLSFTFDAGRYVEQNMLAQKYGIPVIVNPRKNIERTFGEGHWRRAVDLWDEINGFKRGQGLLRVVDDTDRRMFQAGLLGFTPRYHEAAQAYYLKQTGRYSNREIEEIISKIGRYGMGRSAAEKSMNFIFFPFSFQRKLIQNAGDFVMQAPARALLIHHGLWALENSGASDAASRFVEERLPIINQFKYLNNLAQGISPGRFFLEGVKDHPTDTGKWAQAIASIFAPSGAATPVAQTAGGIYDALVHLSVPMVASDKNALEELAGNFERYIPLIRDFNDLRMSLSDQFAVAADPAHTTPFTQLQNYRDELREAKAQYEPMALALGYSSVDGFLQSDAGAGIRAQLETQENALRNHYRSGFELSRTFEDSLSLKEKAYHDLSDNPARTPAHEAILQIMEMEREAKVMASMLNTTQDDVLQSMTPTIRSNALAHRDDPEFRRLWKAFFEYTYGPIVEVMA